MKFFSKIKKKIRYTLEVKKLKKKDVLLGRNIKIRKTNFEGKNTIGGNTNIERTDIGLGSYIGSDCKLPSCKIGRFCSIGTRVIAVIGYHPIEYVSTHPFSHSKAKKDVGFNYAGIVEKDCLKMANEECIIEIGNDVWVGDGVQILNGVKIGDGSVIGAGAVITKNVEPYSIVVGVPGKVLRKRFSDEIIDKLLEFKWWNKNISWIEKNAYYFHDIEKFMEIVANER